MIYPTCETKEVWRPAMSTPLMELERDLDGVLDTVSTVNAFRSLKKKHPISPVRKRNKHAQHAKRDSIKSLPFSTNNYRALCNRFSTCPILKTHESSTTKNFCAVTQPYLQDLRAFKKLRQKLKITLKKGSHSSSQERLRGSFVHPNVSQKECLTPRRTSVLRMNVKAFFFFLNKVYELNSRIFHMLIIY